MPDESRNDPDVEKAEAWPEVPSVPDLPAAPTLTPNLPRRAKPPGKEEAETQRMGLAYVLPTALAAPVVVLTLAGYWLDSRFHKSPWFTLGGALLGMISGFINMIRMANKLNR